MTDQTIPADQVREIVEKMYHHANHDNVRGTEEEYVRFFARQFDELLPAPPRPTLADMPPEERGACRWMQADTAGSDDPCVLFVVGTGSAKGVAKGGRVTTGPHECFTPRPDLPRLEWPAAAPVPPNTLTEGSVWDDEDALEAACDGSWRDQITVIDRAGNVSVWDERGADWRGSIPLRFAPFTILRAGKNTDQ